MAATETVEKEKQGKMEGMAFIPQDSSPRRKLINLMKMTHFPTFVTRSNFFLNACG